MTWGKVIPWILVAALVIFLIFYIKGCNPNTDREGQLQDSVFYWKDSAGHAVASIRAKEVDFNFIQKHYKDSIAGLLDTKADLVKEIIDLKQKGQVVITVPGDAPPPVIKYVDTGHTQIEAVSQVFSNPWYQAIVDINLRDNLKSQLQLQTFDSLLISWKTVKTGGFLNRKSYLQLDVKNSNPYNTITQAKAYRVPPPDPKKWGIGISAGWGYGFNTSGAQWGYPIIGVTVQRTFIRF